MNEEKKNLDTMTAQPLVVEIEGRELEFTRLSLDDFGALEMKIKQVLAESTAAVMKGIGEPRAEIMKEINTILTGDVTPNEWTQALKSPENQAYLLYRSVARKHPDITKDEFFTMLPVSQLKDLMTKLIQLDKQGRKKAKNSPGAFGGKVPAKKKK